MSKYTGTKTEKNLLAAFAGESQARNKYTYFSQIAKDEGNDKIAEIFTKTANNEENHAKMWFRELGGLNKTNENLCLHGAYISANVVLLILKTHKGGCLHA